jgi:hypothetical protein
LKNNPRHVTLSHYINDRLPKVDGLVPPVKNPIGDIEKTRRSTSICSFFDKLKSISTKFHPKLANPSPSIQSMKNYSEPKYDIDTTQNISTRRSEKLYELRVKLSKYTPNSVQLLEGSDDFLLPIHLQSKYQTCYNQALCGAWSSSMHVLDVGTGFSFCGNNYMISKSKTYVANIGLFILSHVSVPPRQSVALKPYCGPLYSQSDYLNIVKYKHKISMYNMCMNGYDYRNFNKKNLLYIDGHPQTHGNIAGFINSCKSSLFSAHFFFEEHSNDKEFFMKRKAFRFVVVHAIHSLSLGNELLINYNFHRPPTTHKKCLALGLPLDVH